MIGHDRVYTPDNVAEDMVRYFAPSGRILEPARGEGAIYRFLPPGSDWCEIIEGRDFFAFTDKVDWIISNPPYSLLREFSRHAFSLADNIVWLIPADRYFRAWRFVLETYEYGGLQTLRWYDSGGRIGFPMGNPVAALHWRRSYSGPINVSFWEGRKQDRVVGCRTAPNTQRAKCPQLAMELEL